eukprot:CAMPEP_0113487178 /NCGR_PEP_ID=MMETSP0014_2-20120614/25375_1 /TAXON_ID=2857 /ORGANISM="Nitzschia sp." /LENGTH=672 /DNA_ID=CAMNT_0000380867 /DNA_START=123 /DNA_END=2137 /DNA_ORIENTATION=- /assembly_acc=CAM_ASM_000159
MTVAATSTSNNPGGNNNAANNAANNNDDAAAKNNNKKKDSHSRRGQTVMKLATDRLKRAGIEQLDQLIAEQDNKGKKKKSNSKKSSPASEAGSATAGSTTTTTTTTTPKANTITEIVGDPYDSIELGGALGHGQFHAVYEIKSLGQDSGFPFKIRKNPIEKVVLKTLRVQMSSPSASVEKIATGSADLVKEGMILKALTSSSYGYGHPNIIQLRGWTSTGINAFFPVQRNSTSGSPDFKYDGFCLVIDKLDKTLKDLVGHEWKDEVEWFHERLGTEDEHGGEGIDDDGSDDDDDGSVGESYDDGMDIDSEGNDSKDGHRHHHHHTSGGTVTPSKKGNHNGHSDHHNHASSLASCVWSPFTFWKNLSRRSPEATKALLERKHAFFLRRLYACLELADALQYLHQYRIIHRDLKPANVGIQTRGNVDRLVVFDMDMSRVVSSSSRIKDANDKDDDPNQSLYRMTSMLGSRQYMAPEIAVPNTPYNLKADVYTFGLLVWEMLNVRLNPFGEYLMNDDEEIHDTNVPKMTEGQVDRAIIHDGLRPTIPRHIWCKSLVDVVSSSWAPKIEDRPTMAENYVSLQVVYSQLKSQGEMISALKEEQTARREQREQRRKERRVRKAAAAAASAASAAITGGDGEEHLSSEQASDKTDVLSSSSALSDSELQQKQQQAVPGR